jgi:hypothetical protein
MISIILIWTSMVCGSRDAQSWEAWSDGAISLTHYITDFALRLPGYGLIPGITIPIISFWDGQPLR